MNNEQFRKLLSTKSGPSQDDAQESAKALGAPRSLLGSRQRPGSSMTPRSLGAGYKLTSANGAKSTGQQNKFKSSAPRGSKLVAGYVDRTRTRIDEESDETSKRVKALEEQMKEGEIDEETFERLRDEITGGDISKTHLVKGLDRQLLERIRRGENVSAMPDGPNAQAGDPSVEIDDDAFDDLERQEVVATTKEERIKHGQKAPSVPAAGQKRTRDQILADLKAQREAAKSAARPQLGTGFKKIRKDDGPRIETDNRGREVLVTTDEHGNVKRRVRKVKVTDEEPVRSKTNDQPLGADINVPVFEAEPAEESDGDIFENAGHDFDPLADLGDDDDDASDTGAAPAEGLREKALEEGEVHAPDEDADQSERLKERPQNYFNDDPSSLSVLGRIKNDLNDPGVVAALANSRRLDNDKLSEASQALNAEEEAKRKRREAMLATQDRDMEDMDMGFGGSRFDDQEEMAMENMKVKLSKWKGGAGFDDDEEGGGGKGGEKRKRGPKKRKGDKNSAADVMKVLEGKRKG